MQMHPEIKRFVQETLGCSCPEEVFNKIDYQKESGGISGRKVTVGDRLLIYIITADGEPNIQGVINSAIEQLMQRVDGPFVAMLPREPGKREIRFAHLFGGELEKREPAARADAVSAESGADADRMQQLEQLVKQLRDEVAILQARLDRISSHQDAGS
jgi:hypothetical protein